jgi:hypothetical protein
MENVGKLFDDEPPERLPLVRVHKTCHTTSALGIIIFDRLPFSYSYTPHPHPQHHVLPHPLSSSPIRNCIVDGSFSFCLLTSCDLVLLDKPKDQSGTLIVY